MIRTDTPGWAAGEKGVKGMTGDERKRGLLSERGGRRKRMEEVQSVWCESLMGSLHLLL